MTVTGQCPLHMLTHTPRRRRGKPARHPFCFTPLWCIQPISEPLLSPGYRDHPVLEMGSGHRLEEEMHSQTSATVPAPAPVDVG